MMMSGMIYSEYLLDCIVSEYALPYGMGIPPRSSSLCQCSVVFKLISAQERSLDWKTSASYYKKINPTLNTYTSTPQP